MPFFLYFPICHIFLFLEKIKRICVKSRVSPDFPGPGPDSGIPAIFGSPGPGPGTGQKFRSGSGSGSGFTKDPANPDYFSSTNFMIFNPINFFNNDDFLHYFIIFRIIYSKHFLFIYKFSSTQRLKYSAHKQFYF